MGAIRVTDFDGRTHEIAAVEGWRVMEILREHGFDAGGLCGGACACATCHVVVSEDWVDRLHPANNDEEAMLDTVPMVVSSSRLSCQLIYSEALDGLHVHLAPAA
jgi:ferredoxin, 2Fe-2S